MKQSKIIYGILSFFQKRAKQKHLHYFLHQNWVKKHLNKSFLLSFLTFRWEKLTEKQKQMISHKKWIPSHVVALA